MERLTILTTMDENYLPQLQVLCTSLYVNHPEQPIDLCLLHSGISSTALKPIYSQCNAFGYHFTDILVPDDLFQNAPVSQQYPKEMYYRLLASSLLPLSCHRVLYLDPDILVINPLQPLWETDLKGHLFAAAAHTGKTKFANRVNNLRLGTTQNYYNSGVLLMDLDACRKEIDPLTIFQYVQQHRKELILPDQDVLNALYSDQILPLEDAIWNYDARNYNNYLMRSGGEYNLKWVMEHTAILHFCGKAKPWKPAYPYRFGILYQHYAQLTKRMGTLLSK